MQSSSVRCCSLCTEFKKECNKTSVAVFVLSTVKLQLTRLTTSTYFKWNFSRRKTVDNSSYYTLINFQLIKIKCLACPPTYTNAICNYFYYYFYVD